MITTPVNEYYHYHNMNSKDDVNIKSSNNEIKIIKLVKFLDDICFKLDKRSCRYKRQRCELRKLNDIQWMFEETNQ